MKQPPSRHVAKPSRRQAVVNGWRGWGALKLGKCAVGDITFVGRRLCSPSLSPTGAQSVQSTLALHPVGRWAADSMQHYSVVASRDDMLLCDGEKLSQLFVTLSTGRR